MTENDHLSHSSHCSASYNELLVSLKTYTHRDQITGDKEDPGS